MKRMHLRIPKHGMEPHKEYKVKWHGHFYRVYYEPDDDCFHVYRSYSDYEKYRREQEAADNT